MSRRKRGRPLGQRIIITVDGVDRRLDWVAKERPDVLLRLLCHAKPDDPHVGTNAILSAFARNGLRRTELLELIQDHPEWEVNPGVFIQV
ncbi:MAG: hypothetical protein Q8Q20_03515 [bacterium]|nr:hypothetical protein [bacterium]